MLSCSSLTTHTLPRDIAADTTNLRVRSRFNHTLMLDTLPLNLRPPSDNSQSPSPSRPTNPPSNSTTRVSSPRDAVPSSTTVSSPSDTELMRTLVKSTSSSRTPGVPAGDSTDTSRLPQINAV